MHTKHANVRAAFKPVQWEHIQSPTPVRTGLKPPQAEQAKAIGPFLQVQEAHSQLSVSSMLMLLLLLLLKRCIGLKGDAIPGTAIFEADRLGLELCRLTPCLLGRPSPLHRGRISGHRPQRT